MGFCNWFQMVTKKRWEELKIKEISVVQFHYLVDQYEEYCRNNNISSGF